MTRTLTYLGCLVALSAIAALPVSANAQSIGGARVEIQGGWDHMSIPDQTGSAPGAATGGSRAIYGVGAGYDVPIAGNLLFGLDTNIDFGGKTSCSSAVVIPGDQICNKLRHDWDIGARLGVKSGSATIYGRVAYDDSSARSTYTDGLGNTNTATGSSHGVRLGAGLEYDLTSRVYLKTEYRYTPESRFGDQQQLIGGIGFHF